MKSIATVTAWKLLGVQLFCWLSLLPFYVIADSKWVVASLVGYFLYAGVGVAMTFHRQLSHRTYKFHPLVEKSLIYLASLANVGSALTWVSVHRAHHRYCDTTKDPHSPHHKSALFVLFFSMFAPVQPKLAVDLLRNPYVLFCHKYYFLLQAPVILLWCLIGGWQAVFAMHVIPSGLTWLAGSFVNYWNHQKGYKVGKALDTSTNHCLTGYLVFGEGWHNAHHSNARAQTTRTHWYELDVLYWVAKALGGVTSTKKVCASH